VVEFSLFESFFAVDWSFGRLVGRLVVYEIDFVILEVDKLINFLFL
jgi:hypothetical protein